MEIHIPSSRFLYVKKGIDLKYVISILFPSLPLLAVSVNSASFKLTRRLPCQNE